MVTRGNLFPARFAIDCYRAQSYPNRELVVVCDRPDNEVARWIATLNDPSIRYVQARKTTLGALRNLSVDTATGALLCQWDDDDLYHRTRLAFQQRCLARSGAAAHFLSQWLMWWPQRRLLALGPARLWEGSMLVRREALPRYPEVVRGEDTPVMLELTKNHKVSASKAPGVYCYIVHGGNSWHEAHFDTFFAASPRIVPPALYDREIERLSRLFPIKAYGERLGDTRLYTVGG